MTSPNFSADIRDLAEIAKIDEKRYEESLEQTLDLIAILNHSYNNNAKKEKEES